VASQARRVALDGGGWLAQGREPIVRVLWVGELLMFLRSRRVRPNVTVIYQDGRVIVVVVERTRYALWGTRRQRKEKRKMIEASTGLEEEQQYSAPARSR
jgi:hypothetical protein